MDCDAIVNTANPYPQIGAGTDSAVYAAAGEKRLLAARQKIGEIAPGMATVTSGYALKARYIIHTVGPVYREGNPNCEKLLSDCYWNSLELAKEHDIHSLAFPAISTGVYGYPADKAAAVALRTISSWLSENEDYGMAVVMSCFSERMFETYQKVIGK